MPSRTVTLVGHVIDSLTLPKVLDIIVARGADYRLTKVEIGKTNLDPSTIVVEVVAADEKTLDSLVAELHVQGANVEEAAEANLAACEADGVLPRGFYSTTNLPTRVRVRSRWIPVEYPEMDCALVVSTAPEESATGGRGAAVPYRAQAVPLHALRRGDLVVVGRSGVEVEPPERSRDRSAFEFMSSDASSEKPKAAIVAYVAERVREAHSRVPRGKVLVVCGPAVVHTAAGPDLARLVRDGWVDVLFAGNGFATHDIESNLLGTSLGVSLTGDEPDESGHSNHLIAINEIRRLGSIRDAVEAGYLTSGVMYECVRSGIPFVLGGSIRDDGPLPDVITDVTEAADTMRSEVRGVTVAIMLASTLHSIATGNLLAASVETFCVDIHHAVITKLADRGSHQALGIVTDVGLFVAELASHLAGDAPRRVADPSDG